MDQRTYNILTASLFLVMAVLHVLRLVLGWSAQIGGWTVPFWLSWLALIVLGALAYFGFRLNARHAD